MTLLYRRGLCLRCYQEWRELLARSGGELDWPDLVLLGLAGPPAKQKGKGGYCYRGHKIKGPRCQECMRRMSRESQRRKRARAKGDWG